MAADETDLPPAVPTGQLQDTNSAEMMRMLLQIEDQLRSQGLAIEQNRNEARVAAARNAETLSNGLQTLEVSFSSHQQALSAQMGRELDTIQSSNRLSLVLAGLLGAMAVLSMLIIAFFQWRMSKTWTEATALLPGSPGAHPGPAVEFLPVGNAGALPGGSAEESTQRLLGAIGQLERRVQDLEQSSSSNLKARGEASAGGNGESLNDGNGEVALARVETGIEADPGIVSLMEQGQSLLKRNEWEAALKCFDEVLLLDPNHGQALVKRGTVLERLRRIQEAFECYDRAIAADAELTVAYLHKGGLCSRLERFKEALECYEKALQSQGE